MSGTTDDDVAATRSLAEGISHLSYEDHPPEVRATTERAIIDALGNALLARETPLGRRYIAITSGNSGPVPILGGGTAAPIDAAFATAGLCNALDWDDTVEGAGHPGASVIAAALTASVDAEASVREFLNAVVIGYEVSIRIARALQPSPEQYDRVHGSGTRHALGATAAAAAVDDRPVPEIQELLGFGAQLAPVPHASKFGWGEERLTWLKDNAARAASAGIRARQVATSGNDVNGDGGFAGPQYVLDGNRGFWRMAGSDQCDWDLLTTPLGDRYLLPELAFKPFPCCRWLHCAIEAAKMVADRVSTVETVTVETAQRVAESFTIAPTNQVHAEFSLPFVVRQAIVGRDPVAWYDSEGPNQPDIDVPVSTVADETFTDRFETDRVVGARVEATNAKGESTVISVETPLGSAERPLSPQRSREKLQTALSQKPGRDTDVDALMTALPSEESIVSFCNRLTPTA